MVIVLRDPAKGKRKEAQANNDPRELAAVVAIRAVEVGAAAAAVAAVVVVVVAVVVVAVTVTIAEVGAAE